MKKTLFLLVLLVAVFLSPLFGESQIRNALVIGNGAYSASPLRNAVNDARDIADALKKLDFNVILLTDADREQMEKAIRDFGNVLKRGGVGVFFYSGHGVQVRGSNYLIPCRVDIQAADEVAFKAVDAGQILSKMQSAGNDTNIIILDACRNNPFPGSERSSDRGLAVMSFQPPGSLIAYSTSPGSTAADGTGRNGTFTKHFLKHLKTPGLEVGQLLRRVRADVMAETGSAQIPWDNSSLVSDFYFLSPPAVAVATPTPRPVVTPTPLPTPAPATPTPQRLATIPSKTGSTTAGGVPKAADVVIATPTPAPRPTLAPPTVAGKTSGSGPVDAGVPGKGGAVTAASTPPTSAPVAQPLSSVVRGPQDLLPGYRVRAIRDFNLVKRGMEGFYFGPAREGSPPCPILWDKNLGATPRSESLPIAFPRDRLGSVYFVDWNLLEIVSRDEATELYGNLVKANLKIGDRVRALGDYVKIVRGDTGIYYGPAKYGNPPCPILWDRELGATPLEDALPSSFPTKMNSRVYFVDWSLLEIVR